MAPQPSWSTNHRRTDLATVSALEPLKMIGTLVFSTNHSRFALDAASLPGLRVEDVSAATIPRDFARHARIHRCYLIERR